ncbi:MAG: ABC transporter ATP-binding protein [Bacteroidales bacterium]|nr:ABC transporter ATP-binding protein [Bacteroidales bacterium]
MFEEKINIRDLAVGYNRDSKITSQLLSQLNLSCKKGEITGLIGRNGTGKSTLLKTMAGLLPPLSGEILINNQSLVSYDRKALARLVGFVSTEVPAVPSLKVIELVSLGRYPYTDWTGRLTQSDRDIIHQSVKQAGIENIADKSVSEISDGERQRAMIARALAQDTDILILDEPTAFLDLPNRFEILRLLNHLASEKEKTIIFSTHDLGIALHEADTIWLLHNKNIVTGAPEDLILNKEFIRLFEDSTLDFDDDKGEIRPKRFYVLKSGLKAEGQIRFWTAHALERLGIEIVNEDEDVNISVEVLNGKTVWNLVDKKNRLLAHSVYELCLFLKSIINQKV